MLLHVVVVLEEAVRPLMEVQALLPRAEVVVARKRTRRRTRTASLVVDCLQTTHRAHWVLQMSPRYCWMKI